MQQYVVGLIRDMPAQLGMTRGHFFCGVSQVAVGADTLFTGACLQLAIPQRVFLPQLRDDYLRAEGSDGTSDFTDDERERARQLLGLSHVIEERVVTTVSDRHARFEAVNLAILQQSDVLLCVLRESADEQRGGTSDLMQRAAQWGRALLEVRVGVAADGSVGFTERWHRKDGFQAPQFPALGGATKPVSGPPALSTYVTTLKDATSVVAKGRQRTFRYAAAVIVGTHAIATLLATFAMRLADEHMSFNLVGPILIAEVVLLLAGFIVHQRLHASRATQTWALARLVAEVCRSVSALRNVGGALTHVFSLPLPSVLRPVLHTLDVLHLQSTRSLNPNDWKERRDAYVAGRLSSADTGQLEYYRRTLGRARRALTLAHRAFTSCSALAIVCTTFKVVLLLHVLPSLESLSARTGVLAGAVESLGSTLYWLLAPLAIFLPVAAVAALSLAASFDLEGRVHIYEEMLLQLKKYERQLNEASSEAEFSALAKSAEGAMLGETATWYSRRAFTGVA